MKRRFQRGLTLIELLMIVAAVALLIALLLPALNASIESSRKMGCSYNIRQVGLASMEYEQTYKRLVGYNCTWGYGGYAGIPFWDVVPGYGGAGRWSGFIALLPFLNESPIYQAFHEESSGSWGNQTLCWGPYGSISTASYAGTVRGKQDVLRYVWSEEYKPNRIQAAVFRCPSDPAKMRVDSSWNLARTNYAFSMGDGQVGMNSGDPTEDLTRGAFQINKHYTQSAITDGASNVVAFGEIATATGSSFTAEGQGATEKDVKVQGRAIYELDQLSDFKGMDVNACRALASGGHYVGTKRNWGNIGARCYDTLAAYTGFNTINAPNAGSCTPTNNAWGEGEGIYTVSSYHTGGAHVVTFAGEVKFISELINTTDNRTGTTPSEYYSPGRTWSEGQWISTPNWEAPSPFGAWGAMGTRAGNDYAGGQTPWD